jgi:hypothetical protein
MQEFEKCLNIYIVLLKKCNHIAGLQIEGVLAYFTHLKCQKRIGDDVGDLKMNEK